MQKKASELGFSLVEMMVVVVIIGLMTSAVILTVPTQSSELFQTAERTEKAMTVLSRRSVMTGEILGAKFSTVGFDVFKLSDDGWVIEDGILKPESRIWTNAVPVMLDVNNVAVELSNETESPHVWFLPTGEHPSFKLVLMKGSQRAEISSTPFGVMRVSGESYNE